MYILLHGFKELFLFHNNNYNYNKTRLSGQGDPQGDVQEI